MKKIIILTIIILFFVTGCTSQCPTLMENCTTQCIDTIKEVEKIVYKNNTVYINKTIECPKDNIAIYNESISLVRQIKSCNRQLDECLYLNTSYFNGTREQQCTKWERYMNYTESMMKDWNDYVQT